MKDFSISRIGIAMFATLVLAGPSMALEVQAPDLDPGPGLELPGDIAPPQNGGGGGGSGSGGSSPAHEGEGNSIARAADACPNGGELVVSFDMDADGHPIPTSFTRECILRR